MVPGWWSRAKTPGSPAHQDHSGHEAVRARLPRALLSVAAQRHSAGFPWLLGGSGTASDGGEVLRDGGSGRESSVSLWR